MLKKAAITWSAKQIVKMIRNKSIKFDNSVQRGYVWDKKRASLLISSLLMNYPIPPVFAAKSEDGKYDMLDGKQRMNAIRKFYDGEYALVGVPPVVINTNGVEMEIDINGMKYENFDEDLRDELDSATLTIYYFDGITEEEINEMFFRLNNCVPMNQITLTRVRAKSKGIIKELGQNELFTYSLSAKALESYTNEDIVIKALYVLSGADNLQTKNIREWIAETEIEEKFAVDLGVAFTRLAIIAKEIEKEDKKLAKKIVTKTHLLSLIPFIKKATDDKMKDKNLENWLKSFYGIANKTSVSSAYNDACGSGSSKKEAVTTRYRELEKSYNKFLEEMEESNKGD